MTILVVIESIHVIGQRIPVLTDRELRIRRLHVILHVTTPETSHVIESPTVVADFSHEPAHPIFEISLDESLIMVDIRSCMEHFTIGFVSSAMKIGIVCHDGCRVPR